MLAADLPPTPVVAADSPDPSVIKVGGVYYGFVTANSWAPIFKIIRSTDGNSWKPAGSVFRRRPGWAKDDFWAPDVSRLGTGYALVYSALPKRPKTSWYCTGIAFSKQPGGPWRDLGKPLRCGKRGSIDSTITRDENNRLTLVFKEDGNYFHKPAQIFAQQLSEDGRSVIGSAQLLFRNTITWEGKVVEAPTIIRRPDAFYMLYSGGLCCTSKCAYAVGVARSPTLIGRWEKFSGNPVMSSGNGWSCPGHTTVVDDDVFFHAYRAGAGAQLSGRQLIRDKLAWGADGWPTIGNGYPTKPTISRTATPFAFDLTKTAPPWEFQVTRPAAVTRSAAGTTVRAAPGQSARPDAGVAGVELTGDRYTATTVVDRGSLRGKAEAGISSYHASFEAIGLTLDRAGMLDIWQLRRDKLKVLRTRKAPAGSRISLRMRANGDNFRFSASGNGKTWTPVGGALHGPLDESARLALTVGGASRATARFRALAVSP